MPSSRRRAPDIHSILSNARLTLESSATSDFTLFPKYDGTFPDSVQSSDAPSVLRDESITTSEGNRDGDSMDLCENTHDHKDGDRKSNHNPSPEDVSISEFHLSVDNMDSLIDQKADLLIQRKHLESQGSLEACRSLDDEISDLDEAMRMLELVEQSQGSETGTKRRALTDDTMGAKRPRRASVRTGSFAID